MLGAEISAMCVADKVKPAMLYVTLYDAPHFSLNVFNMVTESDNKELMLLARMPLASLM